MEFQTSYVNNCNGNMKHLIGISTFYTDFAFKLFYASIAISNSRSSKYYFIISFYYIYHKLAKFEQNPNYTKFGAFEKNLFTMQNISEILLAPF